MNNGILIFSGYNTRAIIALLRVLEAKEVKYVIIAKDKEDEILNTVYSKRVIFTRESLDLEINIFEEYFQLAFDYGDFDNLLIAPTTEALVRFLLSYQDELTKKNIVLPVVNKNLYELISDKYSFGKLCFEEGLEVPKEITSFSNLNFPIVAKPKDYKDGVLRPIIIENIDAFESIENSKCYYFQEYIDGRSIYLLYYFDSKGNIKKISQENLLQQPNGKSIIAAQVANFHNSDISSKYERLFLKYKFRGLIMVEVKQFENRYYMIEANPRIWGPSQLFLNAGVNLFEELLVDYNILCKNQKTVSEFNQSAKYFWFDGLLDVLDKNQIPTSYNNGFSKVLRNFEEWKKADVYNGEDLAFSNEKLF